ncbi:MAG: PD-(D/E)XK nuclease family protein [Actinomycetota bacterium]
MTRLLADIVSLTPSSYENYTRCPRLFYTADLLGVPASDSGVSNDQGLLVHDMLWRVHATGSCHDLGHVTDVLTAHSADTDAIRALVARHAQRCPSGGADSAAHEHELARFHRLPPPMFMATARLDAIWVHDGLLDARDYKTGSRFYDRVADIPAAKVQAFVLGAAASARGLQPRLRYEYLQPEIDEDPEPWEPDDDDLALVEEELRGAVEAMWARDDWRGVAEPDACGTCRYRSICRDSATPAEPTWPVLSSSA